MKADKKTHKRKGAGCRWLILPGLFLFSASYAQLTDSTVYHQVKNDPRILGIHYAQVLFKNGKVKKEGWEFTKENNRTDGKYWGVQYEKYPVIIFRVGEWKEYRKNGKLKLVENIPLKNDSIRHEKHYNRKGEFVYEFYFSGKEELDYKLTGKSKRRKLKTFRKKEYRKGKIYLEESYKNGKKDGVWKEYNKDGGLEYTTEYMEGKKVKRTSANAKF